MHKGQSHAHEYRALFICGCAVRLALTPGRFWDEQCFRDNFSTWFDFESFVQQEEPESVSLAKQTFITIALARKKVPL